MNHRLMLTSAAFLGLSALTVTAEGNMFYRDRQFLGNVASEGINPVNLAKMPVSDYADIHAAYGHTDGKFRLIDQPQGSNGYVGSFSGMKKIDRVTFCGEFIYDNTTLKNRRWNNTLFVSDRNPFVIGDSLSSKFSNETFHLNGAAAYNASDLLTLALSATYDVGSSATQKDPRPEIKGMRFNLTPGIEFKLGSQHSAGISGNVEWLSEQVSHTVVRTTVKQYVFLFQGLGVFETKDAVGYTRKYNGMRWGINGQYSFNNNPSARISDFLGISYFNEYEDAIDGGASIRYKGGRYSSNGFSFTERLMFRKSKRTIHNFTLEADMFFTKGRWYTQRQTTDADMNLSYEVINENDNLQSSGSNASIEYRFDRLDNNGTIPEWQAVANIKFENTLTKNMIYGMRESITNATLLASVTKRFAISKGWLGVSLRGAFRMNISNELNISGAPQTYKKIMDVYTRPQFEALHASYWQGGGELTYSYPLALFGYSPSLEVALESDIRQAVESLSYIDGRSRFNIGARIGFIF